MEDTNLYFQSFKDAHIRSKTRPSPTRFFPPSSPYQNFHFVVSLSLFLTVWTIGYPTENVGTGKKKQLWGTTKKRGDRSFIEGWWVFSFHCLLFFFFFFSLWGKTKSYLVNLWIGCSLFALCCCWLCEACCWFSWMIVLLSIVISVYICSINISNTDLVYCIKQLYLWDWDFCLYWPMVFLSKWKF